MKEEAKPVELPLEPPPTDMSPQAVWRRRARACRQWLAWFLTVVVTNWGGGDGAA